MKVRYLPNDYCLVECKLKKLKNTLMKNRLLMMDGLLFYGANDLEPNFNHLMHVIKKIPMWFKLFNFPLEYQNKQFLKVIRDELGYFIRMDDNMENGEYGICARICVEVDPNDS
ncbi:hypothetical protein SUGI_0542230 [Cryptomeria japonica]|nr:hypothetical protein SUGI_0542230 [Cryptomeria japonica]